MEAAEFEKSKRFIIARMDCYETHGVYTKTIINRPSGTVSALCMDRGERLSESLSRFDNFIQIIEGTAEVQIDEHTFQLISGESIIIPANSKNTISAKERCKMISTIIKSGYE